MTLQMLYQLSYLCRCIQIKAINVCTCTCSYMCMYSIYHRHIPCLTLSHKHKYFAGGAGAEADIAKHLEKITTIIRLGYNFTSPSIRTKVDGYVMRNTDLGNTSIRGVLCIEYYELSFLHSSSETCKFYCLIFTAVIINHVTAMNLILFLLLFISVV